MRRGNFDGKRSPLSIIGIVCGELSKTVVNYAKTAEPIDISFGLWARMGPRKL